MPYDASQPLRVQVAQSVAASLRNLKSSYIDCLLLHSPLPNHKDLMEVWRAMEAEVKRGSVRALGISNCYALPAMEKLWAEAAVKPLVLQNRCVRSPLSLGCPQRQTGFVLSFSFSLQSSDFTKTRVTMARCEIGAQLMTSHINHSGRSLPIRT